MFISKEWEKTQAQTNQNQWPRNVKAESAFPESKICTAVTFTEIVFSF